MRERGTFASERSNEDVFLKSLIFDLCRSRVVVVVLFYRRSRYSHHVSLSLFFLFSSLHLNRRFVQRQNVQRHRAERFGKVPAREV